MTALPAYEIAVADAVEFFSHGWHSWSTTRWVPTGSRRRPIPDQIHRLGHDDPVHALDETLGGSDVGAVSLPDGTVVLLGALVPGGWVQWRDQQLVGYGGVEADWYVATGSESEVFGGYAAALSRRFDARNPSPPRLWCSWYSFYEDISAAGMVDVLEGLRDLPFDVVQVDDGWQQAIGDWQPNAKFATGMADVADRVTATGRRPGLWLAPFIAHGKSKLFRNNPDWFLTDGSGDPVRAGVNWGAPYFALDVTHPGARDHLRSLFEQVMEWGYRFLKLDFIYAAAYPARRHEQIDRHFAYRDGLSLIRQIVGDDVYLLGCGAPVIASLGIVDGLRVGPDVSPDWAAPDDRDLDDPPGTRAAIATTTNRLWLRSAANTDPDVAFFRSKGMSLNEEQVGLQQALGSITRFRGTSDPPAWLRPPEREALAAWLSDPTPEVSQASRYRWDVGGKAVDFSAALDFPIAWDEGS